MLALQGQVQEACDSFRRALAINPDFVGALGNLGIALKDQGSWGEAVACFTRALALDPFHGNTHNNLGFGARAQGKFTDAIACYREALRLNPAHAEAHNNLGNVLMATGAMEEAAACYEKALGLKPGFPLCANRGLLRLLLGDFDSGWPDYENRSALPGFIPHSLPTPRWDGALLAGKAILIHAEQGLGDTLQFIRYAPLVKGRGGRVIFECQPALGHLLAEAPGVDELVPSGSPMPNFDCHAPLMSLPGIFRTTLGTIPADIPYVHACPRLVEQWGREMRGLTGLKVGIVWQGSAIHKEDRN